MKSKLLFSLVLGVLFISLSCASDYQLRKVSELNVGEVIVGPDGEEVLVSSLEFLGQKEEVVYEKSDSLMDVVWGKIAGRNLPGPVVSGGSSSEGLSLGEYGTGIRISGNVVTNFVEPAKDEKSFWDKLFFWRSK
jgi:hypothetical protein